MMKPKHKKSKQSKRYQQLVEGYQRSKAKHAQFGQGRPCVQLTERDKQSRRQQRKKADRKLIEGELND